mmetsp:Transcript_20477/g.44750  ORF Transcript_20477/g.44750 Transcript_20477/m.44750 type:complete len:87 (+) Transcript_20477:1781-2041(+)
MRRLHVPYCAYATCCHAMLMAGFGYCFGNFQRSDADSIVQIAMDYAHSMCSKCMAQHGGMPSGLDNKVIVFNMSGMKVSWLTSIDT